MKTSYQILIFFNTSILNTTCHEIIIQFSSHLLSVSALPMVKADQANDTLKKTENLKNP